MRIRLASEADWPAIWPFYRVIVEAGETYSLPDEPMEAAIAQWFAPGHTVVVAVEDDGPAPGDGTAPIGDGVRGTDTVADGDTVLGSAHYGPNRPARGAHVSTASFMVAPEAAGRGIGRALGEHVVAAAAADGYRSMQFNAVVETNTAAVKLWTSLGFRIIGTVPEAFDHATEGLVGLHIMLKRFERADS